jgi:hypothetical protein
MRKRGLLIILPLVLLVWMHAGSLLSRAEEGATPTPSATLIPSATATGASTPTWVVVTATATPSPTATAQPTPVPDAYEPNNSISQATPYELGGTLEKLSFWPAGDVDNFTFLVKATDLGLTLTVDTRISYGLDTRIRVLWPDGRVLAENDDAAPGEKRSHLAILLQDQGYFVIEVTNQSITDPAFKLYSLETRVGAPGAPAPTPAISPTHEADAYENNYDFDHAPLIPLGQDIDGLNFACPMGVAPDCGDNDFYQVQLKGGTCYEAETKDLDPALDTNLIVYGSTRELDPPLAGNDDAAPGELRSATSFCVASNYGSIIGYVLVGNAGNRTPPAPVGERTYVLRVSVVVPPTPVPSATMALAATPSAGEASTERRNPSTITLSRDAAPAFQPRSLPGVTVEEISLTQELQPTPRPLIVVPLALRACYDRNQNQFCDIDEGIAGLTVYVTNGQGRILAQALSDSTGLAQLTVRADEAEQLAVSVPYFAFRQTVAARSPKLRDLIVSTVAPIPALLP